VVLIAEFVASCEGVDSGEYICLLACLYCVFTKLLSEFHVVAVYAALFGLRHCVDVLIEQYVNIEV